MINDCKLPWAHHFRFSRRKLNFEPHLEIIKVEEVGRDKGSTQEGLRRAKGMGLDI